MPHRRLIALLCPLWAMAQDVPRPDPLALEPGLYIRAPGGNIALEPERVIWQTGSYSCNNRVASANVTGKADRARSGIAVRTPAEFIVVASPHCFVSNLKLVRLEEKEHERTFVVRFMWDSNALVPWRVQKKKSDIPFEIVPIAARNANLRVPALPEGEYGFIMTCNFSVPLPADRIYAFRAGSEVPRPSVSPPGDDETAPGVYLLTGTSRQELAAERFEWYPMSFRDEMDARFARVPGAEPRDRSSRVSDPCAYEPDDYEVRPDTSWDAYVQATRMNGDLPPAGQIPILSKLAEVLIVAAPGTSIADYPLLSIDSKPGRRRVRVGAVLVNEAFLGFGTMLFPPGPRPIPYDYRHLGRSRYLLTLPKLKPGEYGILGPGMAAIGRTGTVHSFLIR